MTKERFLSEKEERNKQIAIMLKWIDEDGDLITPIHLSYNRDYKEWADTKQVIVKGENFTNTHYINVTNEGFSSDYNWLHEAIDFINEQYYNGFPIICTIGSSGCSIRINDSNVYGDKYKGNKEIVNTLNLNYNIIEEEERIGKKEAIFIAVSDFAVLYNQNVFDIKYYEL